MARIMPAMLTEYSERALVANVYPISQEHDQCIRHDIITRISLKFFIFCGIVYF
jgi:hypothetical protein